MKWEIQAPNAAARSIRSILLLSVLGLHSPPLLSVLHLKEFGLDSCFFTLPLSMHGANHLLDALLNLH